MKKYSTLILRLGLGIVVLWFSINQFMNPDSWTRLVPEYISFLNPATAIYINATIELIIGILLILGLFTRIAALIFSLHLIPIIVSLGYGPTAVRDFGLSLASLSLALSGSNYLSLDSKIKKSFFTKDN